MINARTIRYVDTGFASQKEQNSPSATRKTSTQGKLTHGQHSYFSQKTTPNPGLRFHAPFLTLRNESPQKPTIAIIDDFATPRLDINGNEIKDIPHGVGVEAVLRSKLPCNTVRYQDPEVKVPGELIIKQVDRILKDLDSGKHIDAVNISSGFTMSLRILQIKLKDEQINLSNLHQHREKIRDHIIKNKEKPNLDQTILAIEKLTSRGIPVYLAGGNQGAEYVNVFGFARGSISVGAVNAKGKKISTTAENSLLTYAQGVFGITKLKDGFDINGNNEADLKMELSKRASIPAWFSGKSIHSVLTLNKDDYESANKFRGNPKLRKELPNNHPLRQKLFSIRRLSKFNWYKPNELKRVLDNGYEFTTFDGKFFFKPGAHSSVSYDPEGSGRTNQIGALSGTSFACPMRLAQDFSKPLHTNRYYG